MSLNNLDERTREILSEELEEYDEESVSVEVEQALADAPTPTSDREIRAAFELFEDDSGAWRWRLVAENGEILAVSQRAYSDQQAVAESVGEIKQAMDSAGIVPA